MIIIACACGCVREPHKHYRPGSDCGNSHPQRCLHFRPRLRWLRIPDTPAGLSLARHEEIR